ncbi:DUF6702 family protein [Maribellus sp. YY47]|uniref:DUF6702 family protein n=1 Tax=Maribellus sp. YY47 TaxID=2929486 RepID=UPI0020018904|nr:DUF6702 family protein [Maribellus sp. YY47]MCK3683439.1 hypothetical protein [Maribellus sp. YY47]
MKIIKKYLLLLLLVAGTALSGAAHPYYISLCQVKLNSETASLEIQVKTFADDLLLGLQKAGHDHLYLGEERENPETNQYIFDYLKKVLNFRINDKELNYEFVGKEMENGTVWTYLEISGVKDFTTIEVKCSLLTEVLETQANMIQVQKGETIKNLLLNKRTTNGALAFND